MGDAGNPSQGKLTLYTNHGCPWAHRAHIAVKELGLSYDEVIIDLENPREEWYLEINKRGLVPTLQHEHSSLTSSAPATVIESGLVVQYLVDAFPQLSAHVLPDAKDPESAYKRYTINLLTDTWFNKINWIKPILMSGTDEGPAKADELYESVRTHIEPMLAAALMEGAGPFVGGSQRMTMFEILTAPFVLRINAFCNDRILPASLGEKLKALPAYSNWSKAVCAQESVTYIWDEQKMVDTMVRRAPEMRKKYGIAK